MKEGKATQTHNKGLLR